MHSETSSIYYVIFTAATAIAVTLQMLILLGMFLALRKAQKKVEALIDEARVHLMPMIATSRGLVDDLGPKVTAMVNDLTPKIKTISSNVVETTSLVRSEAEHIKATVDEVVGRTRGQAARVDGMVTGTLNGVEHATATIQNGVNIPLRKISGWVAGVKAAVEVLGRKRPSRTATERAAGFDGVGGVEPAATSYAYTKPGTGAGTGTGTSDFVV